VPSRARGSILADVSGAGVECQLGGGFEDDGVAEGFELATWLRILAATDPGVVEAAAEISVAASGSASRVERPTATMAFFLPRRPAVL
jgi:hypothetical protein